MNESYMKQITDKKKCSCGKALKNSDERTIGMCSNCMGDMHYFLSRIVGMKIGNFPLRKRI